MKLEHYEQLDLARFLAQLLSGLYIETHHQLKPNLVLNMELEFIN
jgi:hypothetical protein